MRRRQEANFLETLRRHVQQEYSAYAESLATQHDAFDRFRRGAGSGLWLYLAIHAGPVRLFDGGHRAEFRPAPGDTCSVDQSRHTGRKAPGQPYQPLAGRGLDRRERLSA